MSLTEAGLYIIKDEFFDKFDDGSLKQNKSEHRPLYYCFKIDNLLWMIPLSSRYEKYKKIYDRDIKRIGRCDKFYFMKIKDDKFSVFLIQDVFPVSEEYIEREYLVNDVPYILKNEVVKEEIEKRAKKIIVLTKRGKKINPTQPNILEIANKLIESLTQEEVAIDRKKL